MRATTRGKTASKTTTGRTSTRGKLARKKATATVKRGPYAKQKRSAA